MSSNKNKFGMEEAITSSYCLKENETVDFNSILSIFVEYKNKNNIITELNRIFSTNIIYRSKNRKKIINLSVISIKDDILLEEVICDENILLIETQDNVQTEEENCSDIYDSDDSDFEEELYP